MSQLRKLVFILSVIATLLFSILSVEPSFAEEDHEHHHEEPEEHSDEHDDSLALSKEQLDEFEIVLRKAEGGIFEEFVETPGAVVVNEERVSHISARFPGIVTNVLVRIGDTVQKDDTLAVIESSESLRPYSIKSQIGGTVIAKHATLGELLKDDDIAYTVADLSSVWVNLSIYQADISKVAVGQRVEVSQGHSEKKAVGVISYLSPVIDEDTRTATARVVLPNPDGSWMPGLFVTARIKVTEKTVSVLVPITAVLTFEDKSVVFVRSEGKFIPAEVKIADRNDSHVVIKEGLELGQEYVAEQGFTLKAELSKSSFGHGHSH